MKASVVPHQAAMRAVLRFPRIMKGQLLVQVETVQHSGAARAARFAPSARSHLIRRPICGRTKGYVRSPARAIFPTMPNRSNFLISELLAGYHARRFSPTQVIESALQRADESPERQVWIS